MKQKKIFISGIAGFMASHLTDKLITKNYKVIGVDNLIGGYRDNIDYRAEYMITDVCNRELMEIMVKGSDTVVHTSALAYEGLSVFSPHTITKSIFDATASLLSASIKNGVKKFIYMSSMARYGENEVPFTEDMECRPQDPYGIAKYASELLVKNLCETHGIDYVILVPHNIIGPRQKYDDPFRNVASIMINRMLQGKQPIIYGDGKQKRCFSYIDDVINPIIKVIEEPISHEVINIGPDDSFITINQLAEEIAGIIDFKLDPIYMADRPQEVKLANCNADKAREMLNYKPKTNLNTAIRSIVNYIEKRGPKKFNYHLDLEIINDKTPKTWKDKLI